MVIDNIFHVRISFWLIVLMFLTCPFQLVDEISVDYYRTLAERRRLALTEALEENEQLHHEIDSLKNEINSIRAENSMLKPLAEEAEYLASVLKVT